MPRSATKRAHSSWPIDEKVHDATIVSCFLNMSGLTSIVTLLRSPTKQVVPHTLVARTAAMRPSRPEPHDRTTRYDQGPVAVPPRRFSFCLSSRARVHIPVLTPHRLRVLGPEHDKFCIVLLNTQCEEVPMK